MDSTHLHKWFLLLMLATLALLGLAAYREATPRWRAHQERYLSLTKDASFKPGIQQVMIEDLGRVDRCTTCHLGIDDPAMQGALQPLTRHPGNYLDTHPTEKFGCTVCHGGQGMATTHEGSAHGDLPFWRDPMPRKGLLDYRCGACHASKKVPGAPHLTRGRLLLRSKGCFGCHQIPSYEDERPHAPSLFSERIGQKTTRRWLRAWLQDPYAQYKRSKMPRYRFKAGEIKALTEYLFSLQGDPLPQAADSRGDPDQGKVVLRTSRCVSCHTINGKGGGMGPDLSRVGSKIRPAWLHTFLRDPHQLLPHSLMLAFRFSEQEVDDLVAYLSTELIDDDAPEISEVEEPPVVSKLARRGEDLYRFFGCGNCHPDGQGRTSPKVGPELAGIGTRDAAKLSFGRHHNVRLDMTNWIFLKVKDPRTPGGKVKMPTFRLSDAEVADLTIALMATTKSSIPPGRIRGTEARPVWNPQGEFGRLLRRYRCFSCHQVRGHGGTLSTAPLDREGSEVQRA
jgi:mono/diheme cytochrome c family protein